MSLKHVTYYAWIWMVCPPQCWSEAQIKYIIIWQIRRREFGHIFLSIYVKENSYNRGGQERRGVGEIGAEDRSGEE